MDPMAGAMGFIWVGVTELELSYYNQETLLFTVYPFHGSLT